MVVVVDCSDCRRHLARCWRWCWCWWWKFWEARPRKGLGVVVQRGVLESPGRKVDDGIPMLAAAALAIAN